MQLPEIAGSYRHNRPDVLSAAVSVHVELCEAELRMLAGARTRGRQDWCRRQHEAGARCLPLQLICNAHSHGARNGPNPYTLIRHYDDVNSIHVVCLSVFATRRNL